MKHFLMSVFLLTPLTVAATELDAVSHWDQQVDLSFPVAGVIKAVMVLPGSSVKQGTELAVLDQRVFEANLTSAESRLQNAQIKYEEAQKELERAQGLYDRMLISDHELNLARIDHASAKAALDAAGAGLATAQYESDYSRLQAPFNAVVIKQYLPAGSTISVAEQPQPVLRIAHAEFLAANAVVSASTARKLELDQTIKVKTENKTVNGKLVALTEAGKKAADEIKFEAVVRFAKNNTLPGNKVTLVFP
jgi:multidrug efflux system membrane fusion protein